MSSYRRVPTSAAPLARLGAEGMLILFSYAFQLAKMAYRGQHEDYKATAKKVIVEATAGAQEQSYSFVQVSMSSGADLALRCQRTL